MPLTPHRNILPFGLCILLNIGKWYRLVCIIAWKIGVNNCTKWKWCLLWTNMANTVLHFFFIFCTEWFYVPLLHCCWLYGGFILLFPVTVWLTIKPTKQCGLNPKRTLQHVWHHWKRNPDLKAFQCQVILINAFVNNTRLCICNVNLFCKTQLYFDLLWATGSMAILKFSAN